MNIIIYSVHLNKDTKKRKYYTENSQIPKLSGPLRRVF